LKHIKVFQGQRKKQATSSGVRAAAAGVFQSSYQRKKQATFLQASDIRSSSGVFRGQKGAAYDSVGEV